MTKHVLRRLLHSPGFTAATLMTLAIGIGANTAVFSVVNGILLKPLPYPEPERLVGLWHSAAGLNIKELNMCPTLYFTYSDEGRTFEQVGGFRTGLVFVTRTGRPEQVRGLFVTHEVLPMLGVQPATGRLFGAKDTVQGNPKTAIVSWGFRQSHFGDSSPVGRHVVVDGEDREIVGVLPRNFRFADQQPGMVLPLQYNRAKLVLGNFGLRGIARLRPGVTMAQANADVARMIPIWLRSFPAPPGFSAKVFEDARLMPALRPYMRDAVGDIGSVLWVVMGTIGAVLLIACANVANLLLVRAEGRRHELAIRAALGAGWGAIARELLLESAALGLAGGALGLAFAYGALRLLVAIAPTGLPRLSDIGIDSTALLFTIAVSLIAGLLFGILPVFKYADVRAGTGLRESNRSVSGGRERHRARNVLVVVQVALALLLLIGSGLMIRTFQALRRVDPGFTGPEDLLTLRISIPGTEVKEPERAARMDSEIVSKIMAIPGVESAAMTTSLPMDGNNSFDVLFAEDHPTASGKVPPIRTFKFLSPGFFGTTGRRFLSGRDFTWVDIYDYRNVAIVSENLAREWWGSPAAALGKRVREGAQDDWREIVGVVANEYDDGVQQKAPPVVYFPFMTKKFWGNDTLLQRTMAFAIRSKRAGSAAFSDDVRKVVWGVSANSPLAEVQTMEEIYRVSMARTSFTLVMLSISGLMALLLGLVGIYGVISYSVTQRRREIGIRVALGARSGAVSRMFVRDGLVLAVVGVVCGLGAALSLTRLIKSFLFGVTVGDPYT